MVVQNGDKRDTGPAKFKTKGRRSLSLLFPLYRGMP